MVRSEKGSARPDEIERIRHLAAGEAIAFATTAGTMLLGVLAGAEAAVHERPAAHQDSQHDRHETPMPHAATSLSQQGIDTAADDRAAHDVGWTHDHTDGVDTPAPATDIEHAAPASNVPEPVGIPESQPTGEGIPAHVLVQSIPVWTFDGSAGHALSADTGAGPTEPVGSTSPDVSMFQQLSGSVAGLIDPSLALLSHTLVSLNATFNQLTMSLTATVSHLADDVTHAVTSLINDAPLTASFEPLLNNLLAPQPATETPHAAALLDSAGAVPVALLQPLPLQLGFLGQPASEGHDHHDGAFSALGVHHF